MLRPSRAPKTRPPVSQKNVVAYVRADLRVQTPSGLLEMKPEVRKVRYPKGVT